MSVSIRITHNSVSPGLAKAARRFSDAKPILRVMGVALQGYTVDSFVDPSKRMKPWAPKKDGTASNLTKTTSLRRSIRITELTGSHVDVGTDRPYAAIHQLGGKTRPMPARPYFPFDSSGKMSAPAQLRVERAAKKKMELIKSGL